MPDTPTLANDCFALPEGVEWTPVEDALSALRERVSVVVKTEQISTLKAGGRVLAVDVVAQRSSPPYENSAMDGYGFAHTSQGDGAQVLPLVDGRSAAGEPYADTVPAGMAIRILTGAMIPEGVDTVIMQEDVTVVNGAATFVAPLKANANVRPAGEDILQDQIVLPAGRVLQPQDLGLLASVGVAKVSVYHPLRVGVLSTGDELRQVGEAVDSYHIYDANRPMLLELIRRWGMLPVDLGHVRDDADLVNQALTTGALETDVILTSGGASAGDEDHISAALRAAGALNLWRIAIKPGRPLALGMWNGVPVFGLPGNPVAAFVTALIFARPTLTKLGGAGWTVPRVMTLPAAFSKNKKAGRREYLRARMTENGHVEVFQSEGSGRVSGLSWATGLVELEHGARDIKTGDPVRFHPFTAFGL